MQFIILILVRLYWEGGAAREGGSLQGDELYDVGSGGRRCRPGGQPYNLPLWKGILIDIFKWVAWLDTFIDLLLPQAVGNTTSGCFSPVLGKGLVHAYVPAIVDVPGNQGREKRIEFTAQTGYVSRQFQGTNMTNVYGWVYLTNSGLDVELWTRWAHSGNQPGRDWHHGQNDEGHRAWGPSGQDAANSGERGDERETMIVSWRSGIGGSLLDLSGCSRQ